MQSFYALRKQNGNNAGYFHVLNWLGHKGLRYLVKNIFGCACFGMMCLFLEVTKSFLDDINIWNGKMNKTEIVLSHIGVSLRVRSSGLPTPDLIQSVEDLSISKDWHSPE